jgi:hypothetical protein
MAVGGTFQGEFLKRGILSRNEKNSYSEFRASFRAFTPIHSVA